MYYPSWHDQTTDGTYVAYAWRDGYELGGSYSQALPCSLSVNCTDHRRIEFQVSTGAAVSGIDICDWYGQPGEVPFPPGAASPNTVTVLATATAPPGGISLNCDGTYQKARITD
jgi:hypothetical protein